MFWIAPELYKKKTSFEGGDIYLHTTASTYKNQSKSSVK